MDHPQPPSPLHCNNSITRPGQENLADYPTKHHPAAHHQRICPYYVCTPESPRYLPRALAPHILQGCIDSPQWQKMTYKWQMPLPRIGTKNIQPKKTCITQTAHTEQT
eukprot:2223618-Ditylum_brightwellii.AAC.1